MNDNTYKTLKARLKQIEKALNRALESAVTSRVKVLYQSQTDLFRLKEELQTVKSVVEARDESVWETYFWYLKEVQQVIDKHHGIKVLYKCYNGINAYNIYGGLHFIVRLIVSGGSETERDDRIFIRPKSNARRCNEDKNDK